MRSRELQQIRRYDIKVGGGGAGCIGVRVVVVVVVQVVTPSPRVTESMADLAAPELSEASGIVTAVDSELQRLQKDKTAFDKLLAKLLNR